MRNDIPLARGLGSSAAATVAGIVAANALLGGRARRGHPAAHRDRDRGPSRQRRGGAARRVRRRRHDARAASRPSGSTPARPARGPVHPRAGACRPRTCARRCRRRCRSRTPSPTSGRSPSAWPGWPPAGTDLLARLTVDRLHEPYRAAVYPELPRLVEAAREAGALGACLSGAGSTILAFADSMAGITRIEAAFVAVAADTDLAGRVVVVKPRSAGARVVTDRGSDRQPGSSAARVVGDERDDLVPGGRALARELVALRSKKLCGAPG